MTFDPQQLSPRDVYRILADAIAPRPICFASTISAGGIVNLSPYSFFNVVSGNPPILAFAPQVSGRTGKTKDTLNNVLEVPEVVINVVDHALGEKMSASSAAFPPEINEFREVGLTEVASEKVRPPRVGESPVSFECVVDRVIELSREPIGGSLVLARVVAIHVAETHLRNGTLDPSTLDLIGRMGGDEYVRAREGVFLMPKPE